MALQGVVGWSDPKTVEELKQSFGRDQISFWKLVDEYRKVTHKDAVRKWRGFQRMEKEIFDDGGEETPAALPYPAAVR
jgi:hypothetical protein